MRTTDPGDAARIELLLAELRLPAVKQVWASLATQADKEGWPAGRFLAALAEHEIAERAHRRLERHLAEARLPPGKTLRRKPGPTPGAPIQSPGGNPPDLTQFSLELRRSLVDRLIVPSGSFRQRCGSRNRASTISR
jgi:hypothetical protein